MTLTDTEREFIKKRLSTKPPIICICGSSRFIEWMAVQAWEYEKHGHIALSLHLMPESYTTQVPDHLAEAESVADILDELHLRKIDLADTVLIMNVDGYVGKSTWNEILYARKQEKPVQFFDERLDCRFQKQYSGFLIECSRYNGACPYPHRETQCMGAEPMALDN